MSCILRQLPKAHLRQVIELEKSEGLGTPDEPVRLVTYYLDPESGKVLARYDHMEDQYLREV